VNKQAGSKVYFVTTVMIIKVYNAVMTNASVKLMRGKETMQTDGITLWSNVSVAAYVYHSVFCISSPQL